MTPAIRSQLPLSERWPSSTRPCSSRTTAVTPGSRRRRAPRSSRRLWTYGEIGISGTLTGSGKRVSADQGTNPLGGEADERRRVRLVGQRVEDDPGGSGGGELTDPVGDLGRVAGQPEVGLAPVLGRGPQARRRVRAGRG